MLNSFKNLGINAQFSGRNDIVVDDKKISGSAFKINLSNKKFGPKSLHHGTILLDVDMNSMQRYLHPNKLKLISKGVDSVRSRVLNLKEKIPDLDCYKVFEQIEKEFLKYHNITEYDKIEIQDENNNQNPKIKELFNYYNSWDWKFGECPEFTNSLIHKFDWGLVDLSIRAEKSKIQEAIVYSDSLNSEFIDYINDFLKNIKGRYTYDLKGVNKIFEDLITNQEINNNKDYVKYVEEMKQILTKQI